MPSVLEREVKCYAAIAEDWQQDHHDAMACADAEDILSFGIWIYDRICEADERWRRGVAKKERAYDPEAAKNLKALFGWWLAPCERVENMIRICEQQGFEVAGAVEFRKRHAECAWALTSADRAFDHPRVVEMRDRAVDSFRSGMTEAG